MEKIQEILEKLAKLEEKMGSVSSQEISGIKAEIETLKKTGVDVSDLQRKVEDLAVEVHTPGKGGNNDEKAKLEKSLVMLAQHAKGILQTGIDKDGGLLVSTELEKAILKDVIIASPVLRLATIKQTSQESVSEMIRKTPGVSGGWIGELDSRPVTGGPDYAKVVIPVHEAYASPDITNILLEDADVDMGAEIKEAISEIMTDTLSKAVITGPGGPETPMGITSYPLKLCSKASDMEVDKLNYVKTGANGAYASDTPWVTFQTAIGILRGARKSDNAVWLVNSTTYAEMASWADANNKPLLHENAGQDAYATLLGFPVEIDENMPCKGDSGYPAFAVLANFKRAYKVVYKKGGAKTLIDQYTSKGKTIYYTTMRFGAGMRDGKAMIAVAAKA